MAFAVRKSRLRRSLCYWGREVLVWVASCIAVSVFMGMLQLLSLIHILNVEYIEALMRERRPKYLAAADITVETDGKCAQEIGEEILQKV